jgi:hypothetical protein
MITEAVIGDTTRNNGHTRPETPLDSPADCDSRLSSMETITDTWFGLGQSGRVGIDINLLAQVAHKAAISRGARAVNTFP